MVDYNLKSTIVGESNMYLAPEVEATKSKVGSTHGNLMEEGADLTMFKDNSGRENISSRI